MPPPTVERLAPTFLGVLGAHPLKRQLRLLHAQALQRFPPEEVRGGRSLLIFRRGLDAMDEAPGFSDDGGAIGLRGKIPRRHGRAPAPRGLAIFRHEPGDAFFGASRKIARQATYRQTIWDCSWGSSVEETSRLAVIQRAQNGRRSGPDAFQGFPHVRSRSELGGDAAIH